ncbi:hypothetical protein CLAIMM_01749 [Cladophialophora immunda]|nr:hypothetical protein CLAIMM_01749 [Cladophialophora immunda]
MERKSRATKDDILRLAEPDPELAAWLAKNPITTVDWANPALVRETRAKLSQRSFEALENPGLIMKIPMRDGFLSSIRIYRPESPERKSALAVLLYGGCFMTGDTRQLASYALKLNNLYRVTVVLLSYRLSPENPFPTPQNDVWDSMLWLSANATSMLQADPIEGFVLGGVSAGGQIAAALAQRWVDEAKLPKLTGLWLSIPIIFHGAKNVPTEYQGDVSAREQNRDAMLMNQEVLNWIDVHHRPDPLSPLFSPFNSPNPEKHANLAKDGVRVYIQAAGQDPLRDDALIYERVLRANGIETRLDVYPGVPHGHQFFFPFLTKSKQAETDMMLGFAWLFRR